MANLYSNANVRIDENLNVFRYGKRIGAITKQELEDIETHARGGQSMSGLRIKGLRSGETLVIECIFKSLRG